MSGFLGTSAVTSAKKNMTYKTDHSYENVENWLDMERTEKSV